jgi:phospholipid transport system substrate-binding protein
LEGPMFRFASHLCVSLLMFTVLSSVPATAEQLKPAEVIERFNSKLIECMKRAKELGYHGRYRLLAPVVEDSFDLPFMASQSAGSYWKPMKDEDKALLLKTYTEWSIATYAGRFDGYSGERFDVVSTSEPDRGIVTVVSMLLKPDGGKVDFHYKLRDIKNKWLIVDIQISGVSQLALTRSQFTSVVKDKGVDGLISMLKSKIEAFSRGEKQ